MDVKDGRPDRLIDSAYHCPQWTADQGCPLHGEACGAAVAPSAPTSIRVRLDPANFAMGQRYARQFGGTYDPASKTWSIPLRRNGVANNALNAPRSYGLIPVGG